MILTTFNLKTIEQANDFLTITKYIEQTFNCVVYNIQCGLFATNKKWNNQDILRIWNLKVAYFTNDGLKIIKRESIRVLCIF